MTTESERMQILQMVEEGQISAAQAVTLLKALETGALPAGDEGAAAQPPEAEMAGTQDYTAPETAEPVLAAAPVPDDYTSQEVTGSQGEQPGRAEEVTQEATGISPEEGYNPPLRQAGAEPYSPPEPPNIGRWKQWWQIPLWIGVAVTVIGGILMWTVYQASRFSFWFACSWVPFLIGVAIVALAWASRNMRWLHLRVDQASGASPRRVALSFPIPIRLTAWAVRTFGHRIPNKAGQNVDQVIMALENIPEDQPLFIEVNDDDDKEHVQIFIG